MWKGLIEEYRKFLPVSDKTPVVTLKEGNTPLIYACHISSVIGKDVEVYLKCEGLNPTGSFKARGLSCAVSMCVELGLRRLAIPSAGNAASALAAYAAAANVEANIFMPQDVPQSNFIECKAYGANVTLVDGLISEVYVHRNGGVRKLLKTPREAAELLSVIWYRALYLENPPAGKLTLTAPLHTMVQPAPLVKPRAKAAK